MKTKEQLKQEAERLRAQGDAQMVVEYGKELHTAIKEIATDKAREIVEKLNETGVRAVERVTELIDSENQEVATRNAHFVINHLIGMPTQKSIGTVRHVNIDVLAD